MSEVLVHTEVLSKVKKNIVLMNKLEDYTIGLEAVILVEAVTQQMLF